MSGTTNRRIVLASRPVGAPVASDFRMETETLRSSDDGQMLLRTVYLSLDPYMRGRMSDAPSYAPSVGIGELMVGATVSRVEISNVPGFAVGDWVLSQNGWQEFAISDGRGRIESWSAPGQAFLRAGRAGHAGIHGLHGTVGHWTAEAGRDGGGCRGDRCCGFSCGTDCEAEGMPRGGDCRRSGEVPLRGGGAWIGRLPGSSQSETS